MPARARATGDPVLRRETPGSPPCAHGRHHVVLAPWIVRDVRSGRLPHDEAVAVIAHPAIVAREGLSRQSPAIAFWTLPWRTVSTIAKPLRGLLPEFVWKAKFVVLAVAIWQSATMGPPVVGPISAAVLAIILAIPYNCAPLWKAIVVGVFRYFGPTLDSPVLESSGASGWRRPTNPRTFPSLMTGSMARSLNRSISRPVEAVLASPAASISSSLTPYLLRWVTSSLWIESERNLFYKAHETRWRQLGRPEVEALLPARVTATSRSRNATTWATAS